MQVEIPKSLAKNTHKEIKNPRQSAIFNLSAKMNELVSTDDGRTMTVAQAIADRLASIAMFAESNTDSIAASKLIYDRLYGKAAIEKREDVKPMPKVVFALNDMGIEKVAASVNIPTIEEEDTDNAGILVQTDDGKEMIV